jgi:hypothetical protein
MACFEEGFQLWQYTAGLPDPAVDIDAVDLIIFPTGVTPPLAGIILRVLHPSLGWLPSEEVYVLVGGTWRPAVSASAISSGSWITNDGL